MKIFCNTRTKIENITKSGSSFAPTFVDNHLLPDINFNGQCLINNNISILKKVTNLNTSYILNPWLRNLNTVFTLNNCLFGSVELTKNDDPDIYNYSGCGIRLQFRLKFSIANGSMR